MVNLVPYVNGEYGIRVIYGLRLIGVTQRVETELQSNRKRVYIHTLQCVHESLRKSSKNRSIDWQIVYTSIY